MSEPTRPGPRIRSELRTLPAGLLQRHGALRVLDESFDALARGAGSIVIFTGEAGIGKSTLLDVWRGRMPANQTILMRRCYEDESDEPFAAWLSLIEICDDLKQAVPEPLGSATPSAQSANDLLRRSAEALVDISRQRPLVVAIDDSQWLDVRSVELLRAIARRSADVPVMIVLCVTLPISAEQALRSVLPDLARLPHAQVHELEPLTVESLAELAAGSGRPQLAEWLHTLTNGNPLFAHELLYALVEQDVSPERVFVDDFSLPLSLEGLIEQRLQELPEAARGALTVAALIGDSIDLDTLADVLEGDADELLQHVELALQQGILLEEPDGRVRYRHGLVRRALVSGQPRLRRRRLHARMLPRLRDRPGASPAELARHAEEAGELGYAVDMLERSATNAGRLFALPEAVKSLEHAVLLAERTRLPEPRIDELQLALADVVLRTDRARAARIVARVEARALVRSDRILVARARQRSAGILYEAGRRAEAAELLISLIPELEALQEKRALADALVHLGYCASSESNFVLVEETAQHLRALANELDSPLHRSVALNLLAVAEVARGTPEGAAQMGRESVAILTELGKLDLATPFATVVFMRVDLFASLQRPEMIADLVRIGEELDRTGDLRIGLDPSESFCTPEFCLWHFLTGEWQRGLEDLPSPEALANAAQPQVLKDIAHSVAAEFDLARGDVEQGVRRLHYIAPHPEAALGEHSYQQWLLAVDKLATVDLERGALDQARAWIAALDRALELKPHVPGELLLQCLLAELDLAVNDAAAAETRFSEVISRAAQTGNVLAQLRALRGSALALQRLERAEAGLRAAQQAIDLAGRCRLVYEGALARLTYAEVGLSLRPNDEIFPAVLNEALAVLKDLGATPALQRAERLLEPPARREGPLTTRELDIVELVALGRTDAEIAERLFISRRTVNTHLSNIYGKTGINNRVELSTWAIANGYVNPPTL